MARISLYASNEWAGFLTAIKAAPDDDTVRLIAADWLEEQGEVERAQFIRGQCELAGLSCALSQRKHPPGVACRFHELNRLLVDLAETFYYREVGVMVEQIHRQLFNDHFVDLRPKFWYRHGFVEAAKLHCHSWTLYADSLLAAYPLREVTLSGTREELAMHGGCESPGVVFTREVVTRRAIPDAPYIPSLATPVPSRAYRTGAEILRRMLAAFNPTPPSHPE